MRAWAALAAGGVLYAAAVLWSVPRLPRNGVPLHFDADGTADRFGSRAEALTAQVLIGVVMLGLGVGVVCLVRWGPLTLVNVPHKTYWTSAERRPRLRRMLALDVGVLMGATLAAMALLPVATVAALGSDPVGLPPSVLWSVVGGYVLAVLLWCGWSGRYRYRPDP